MTGVVDEILKVAVADDTKIVSILKVAVADDTKIVSKVANDEQIKVLQLA